MVYVSARALEEELRHLEEELAAARNLEHSTAERHAEEGLQETEAVLEARKIQAEHLEAEREGLVAELRRRAVAEAGWEHDDAGGVRGPTARRCALRGAVERGSSASVPTSCCPSAATSSTTARRGRWRGLGECPLLRGPRRSWPSTGWSGRGSSSPTRSRPCPRGRRDTREGALGGFSWPRLARRGERVRPFVEAQEAPPAKLRGVTSHVLHAQGRTRPREGGAQDHREQADGGGSPPSA